MFSGVKLSIRSFNLFYHQSFSPGVIVLSENLGKGRQIFLYISQGNFTGNSWCVLGYRANCYRIYSCT